MALCSCFFLILIFVSRHSAKYSYSRIKIPVPRCVSAVKVAHLAQHLKKRLSKIANPFRVTSLQITRASGLLGNVVLSVRHEIVLSHTMNYIFTSSYVAFRHMFSCWVTLWRQVA